MLLSMTGFGRAESEFANKAFIVEVKSLNSKFLDIKLKLPNNYKSKEIELRKIITQHVIRGKIEVNIEANNISGGSDFLINEELLKKYYNQLNNLQKEIGVAGGDLMSPILRLPNVVNAFESVIEDDEWDHFKELLVKALEKLKVFRTNEGDALEKDFISHIDNIEQLLSTVEPYEVERITKLRARLQTNLDNYLSKDNIDENRFEQEVVFYLEKLDISEEKVRLSQHCDFFRQELLNKNAQKGRKLNFITQEMGREINTLGAKANSSDIQKIVIIMKDALEKIKEQIANIV